MRALRDLLQLAAFPHALPILCCLSRTFILHTLGGFNEYSVLRCRRPAYRLPQPPQPLGASEWLSREGEATDFWEEMEKLYEEAPEAAPEGEL